MLGKLGLIKSRMQQLKKRGVKVKFTSCGKVLIDGLPFSFSVASDGEASKEGIVISFSGEAVENGTLRLGSIEMNTVQGGHRRKLTKKLAYIEKKDGKHIYQAKFTDALLGDSSDLEGMSGSELLLADISGAYSFKVTPEYKQPEDAEVMLTVYPIDEPLSGLAVEWRDCTSDKDWFIHNPDALKAPKKHILGR